VSYITNKIDDKVVAILKDGGVGFMPSDTIYGLSCAALNKSAVIKLCRLKQRGVNNKAFIVLISGSDMLSELNINPAQAEAAKKYWPGALTFV